MLSRREFIKSMLIAPFAIATGLEDVLAQPIKPISFEEALATEKPEVRQKYIDQLVAIEQSPYANKVVYDHDKSLAKKAVSDYFSGIIGALSLDGDKEARNLFTQLERNNKEKRDECDATTLLLNGGFGRGIKSDIYAFGSAFKKYYGNEKVKIPSTEEAIRALLRHEYSHAKDNFYGIKLTDKLRIDGYNITSIHPEAVDFVEEMRAYLDQINFSRKFGETHPAYLSAALAFARYIYDNAMGHKTSLKPQDFNDYEKELIDYYMERLNQLGSDHPKVLEFMEVFIKKK